MSNIQPTAKTNWFPCLRCIVFILYLHKHDSEKCPWNFTYQNDSYTLEFLQIQGNFEHCLPFFQKLSPTEWADSLSFKLICCHAVAVVAGPWHEWWQSQGLDYGLLSLPLVWKQTKSLKLVYFWSSFCSKVYFFGISHKITRKICWNPVFSSAYQQ